MITGGGTGNPASFQFPVVSSKEKQLSVEEVTGN
jgi:hypothetical protein